MNRVLIACGTGRGNREQVWRILDDLKPTDVIVRNQPGVDAFAWEWATKNHVRSVRAPLSSLVKHLLGHQPDAVVNFGAGRDRTLHDFIGAAKRQGIKVIPVSY